MSETPDLVLSGALGTGFLSDKAEIVLDPIQAIDRAFEVVRSGDMIAVQVDDVEPILKCVMEHFNRIVEPPIAAGI